ncbi:MAG: hypothetical protein FWB78_10525 [Treponema sp.]|nr:hypothetical protein [Treponema sp.]
MSKVEGLTHLHGNQLTEKDNPVIVFRGKLDTLCAMILEAQLLGEQAGNGAFVDDLQEILEFTRRILPAEYKGTPMGEFRLLGMTGEELRDRCRHPERHFGHGHLLMEKGMGALCLRLNLLRTLAREAEVSAVRAFRDPSSPAQSRRPDILEALNRLSTLFYVLTYKYLPTDYFPQGNAGI